MSCTFSVIFQFLNVNSCLILKCTVIKIDCVSCKASSYECGTQYSLPSAGKGVNPRVYIWLLKIEKRSTSRGKHLIELFLKLIEMHLKEYYKARYIVHSQ